MCLSQPPKDSRPPRRLDPRLIEQYQLLHERRRYGATSNRMRSWVGQWITQLQPKTLLDYGCGRSSLSDFIQKRYGVQSYKYDPAISAFSSMPIEKADLVINTDVMEHIPEPDVGQVLQDIRRISPNAIFAICTTLARTVLPNGENAHCTVRPKEWWIMRILEHFPHASYLRPPSESRFYVRTWELP